MTVTWADSVCLHRSIDERSRESSKTKVDKAIGWFVGFFRINVDLAIFQSYLDLEAGDN